MKRKGPVMMRGLTTGDEEEADRLDEGKKDKDNGIVKIVMEKAQSYKAAPSRPRRLEDIPLLLRVWEVAYVIFPMGCYAFGGPAAIAIFYEVMVTKLHWVTPKEFAELLALGNAIPGPNTSIMTAAMGAYRAGALGAIVGFVTWSLPTLIVMIAGGMGMTKMTKTPDWMIGLAPGAVALVFAGFARLSQSIIKTKLDVLITTTAATITIIIQNDPSLPPKTIMWVLPVLLATAGLLTLGKSFYDGWSKRRRERLEVQGDRRGSREMLNPALTTGTRSTSSTPRNRLKKAKSSTGSDGEEGDEEKATLAALAGGGEEGRHLASVIREDSVHQDEEKEEEEDGDEEKATYDSVPIPLWVSAGVFAIFLGILIYLLLMHMTHEVLPATLQLFDGFFIIGVTTYGGGQVVLPVLIDVCVKENMIGMNRFMEGFALVQMLPGPLYNIAGFIGAVYMGLSGAVIAWLGLNLPSLLLVIAFLPLWDRIRRHPSIQIFLGGVNCAAMGLILAVGLSLYMQVVTTTADGVVTVIVGALVGFLNFSSLVSVIGGGLVGFILSPTLMNIGQNSFATSGSGR